MQGMYQQMRKHTKMELVYRSKIGLEFASEIPSRISCLAQTFSRSVWSYVC